MKRVRINVGKVGIVIRRGDYKRVLTAGKHWVRLSDKVGIYFQDQVYKVDSEVEIMLQDEKFKSEVEIVHVLDCEIAVQFKRNNYVQLLKPGIYFYFKGYGNLRFEKIDLRDTESANESKFSTLKKVDISSYLKEVEIGSSEEGLLFIDGKFVRRLKRGLYFYWKYIVPVEVLKVDLRQIQLEISGQELLTKDKAALRINFQASYCVVDSEKALLESKDFQKQLYTAFQLALRAFVGTLTLDELLEAKDKVSAAIFKNVKAEAEKMGVEVMTSGIRDIILPGEVRDIMNQVLVAQKSAEANTIARREETASTRTLLNTAKLMEENEMLFRLKEMEFIEKIADNIGEVNLSSSGQVLEQLSKVFSK